MAVDYINGNNYSFSYKLEEVSDQWRLKTVWGVGYKFEVTAS